MTIDDPTRREFTLTWTLDAPAADAFRAWTEPEQLDWFYNDGQPIPDEPIEVDLRVGGVWRQRMVLDDDTTYLSGGVYREIVPDRKLVFSWGAAGGWPELDPVRPDDSPLVTVVLDEQQGRTELTVQVQLPETFVPEGMPEGWFGHVQDGWRDTVGRLESRLAAAAPARSRRA